MSVESLLDHRLTVKRPGQAETDFGVEDAFADVATDVPASVQRADAKLRNAGAGDVEQGTHRIFFGRGADVAARDVLDVTAGPEAPVTLRVLSVTKPRGHHVEAAAEVWEGDVPA